MDVETHPVMFERFRAAMVLAAVGDALGYKNGEWEFCHSGSAIHKEIMSRYKGLANIKVTKKHFRVSDDTVMHLATAEALTTSSLSDIDDKTKLYLTIAEKYKECMHDMAGRAPGATCMAMVHKLKPNFDDGYKIPFNTRGGGCGAAMRAMCIGLRYHRPEEIDSLIAVSVESGRMTHHHPTGYLGALAAALFTAYSIQDKPVEDWGYGLIKTLEIAKEYVKNSSHFVEENMKNWDYFTNHWLDYLKMRFVDGKLTFPGNYDDANVRDQFYKSISFGGWGGASGHDSSIIAYDAILGAKKNWEQLCYRGVFHGGDSDSTGTIAACTYGARYGFEGVPEKNYLKLEYRERLEKLAAKLYKLAFKSDSGHSNPTSQGTPEVN